MISGVGTSIEDPFVSRPKEECSPPIKKSSTIPSSFILNTLLIDSVLEKLLSYLKPPNAVNFLCCCRNTLHHDTGWKILLYFMNLWDFYQEKLIHQYPHPKQVVTYSIYKLGFNCARCYKLLHGPDGFFAFSNMCRKCSILRLREEKSGYIESNIRFFLCGNMTISTKGYAFLTYPYWISVDDSFTEITSSIEESFQIAQNIVEEKVSYLAIYCKLPL
jgi:hypothetical protein